MISVIIPCFCCATTIRRAVASVFCQTLLPAELILVDDASSDNCETLNGLWQLRDEYFGLLNIVIVVLKTNVGVGSARNAGWDSATQPYIAFLDSDDSWHKDKLKIQYDCMTDDPAVILCGHLCIWLQDGQAKSIITMKPQINKISAKSLLFTNSLSTPTVMIKRAAPFRFQVGKRHCEDLLLWQLIAFSGLQVIRIESTLAYVHKPFYGAKGLGAQLWKMEHGELSNFAFLYRSGYIGIFFYISSTLYSLMKFVKRLLVTKAMHMSDNQKISAK